MMMGGKIWAESLGNLAGDYPSDWEIKSDSDCQGSRFYFTLKTIVNNLLISDQTDFSHKSLLGKRVLIVDDNEINCQVLMMQCHKYEMETVTVNSGKEALSKLKDKTVFDLAILDMQMPEMDGVALAQQIHSLNDYHNLPLVLLSSIGNYEIEKVMSQVNWVGVVNKPIKQSQLYDLLISIFDSQSHQKFTSPIIPEIGNGKHNIAISSPLKILIAEDNVINQKVITNILKRLGYRADIAANGLELLENLRRQSYDLILMDVQMPEMDG
jgi:CheY-like chemotaxis protein